ncbi:endonuclease [Rhabdochromatium marinum]|uniref:endonuclease n=1 Tax=Rhabdochromatium marinum TaxID=48729 RepID=UPI0019084182|nr:endonuclease [Rhabdochromatium marinum]MBK1648917.1 hypothetical protein [Rhabdochromatium marinum]
MARAPRRTKGRSSRKPPQSLHRQSAQRWHQLWRSRRLRYAALALVALLALSYLPPPLVKPLPEPAQQALSVTVEIRESLFEATQHIGAEMLSSGDPAQALDDLLDPNAWLDRLLSWFGWRQGVPESFPAARKVLYEQVYRGQRTTFYCGCRYDRSQQVDLRSCGLDELSNNNRAQRVEAEHVFPASQFGQSRPCWQKPNNFSACRISGGDTLSGRDCCERVDPVFRTAHNDLHNLFPSVGYVNGQRSNYRWGTVSGGETYGDCDIRIDGNQRLVQPPMAVRGDIARTMLYMRQTYDLYLNDRELQLYRAWNNQDPPDAWEIKRNRRIRSIEGISNPFIDNYQSL